MTKTDEYKNGVMAITSLASKMNPKIGTYQEHFVNEGFGFSVRLANGAIKMSREVAQDYESMPSSVTSDRIEKVANTFGEL